MKSIIETIKDISDFINWQLLLGYLTLIVSFIGALAIFKQIKTSRTTRTFDSVLKKRYESINNLINAINEVNYINAFINDYEKCKFMHYDGVIPRYSPVFENIESIEKYIESIGKCDISSILSKEVYIKIHYLRNYLENIILFYRRDKLFLKNNQHCKVFLSMDLQYIINDLSTELASLYLEKNMLNFTITNFNDENATKKIQKKSVEYMKNKTYAYKISKLISSEEYYKKLKEKTKKMKNKEKEMLNFYNKFNCCKSCNSSCILKINKEERKKNES